MKHNPNLSPEAIAKLKADLAPKFNLNRLFLPAVGPKLNTAPALVPALLALKDPFFTSLWFSDRQNLNLPTGDDKVLRLKAEQFRKAVTLEQALAMDQERAVNPDGVSGAFDAWVLSFIAANPKLLQYFHKFGPGGTHDKATCPGCARTKREAQQTKAIRLPLRDARQLDAYLKKHPDLQISPNVRQSEPFHYDKFDYTNICLKYYTQATPENP